MEPEKAAPPEDLQFFARGQHVWFTAPTLDAVYAFAREQGTRVLDVKRNGSGYLAKVMETK